MVSKSIAILVVWGVVACSQVGWAQNQSNGDDIFAPDIGQGSPLAPEGDIGFGPGADPASPPPDQLKPPSREDLPIFPTDGSGPGHGVIFPMTPDGADDPKGKKN